jgi:hypothetical protein
VLGRYDVGAKEFKPVAAKEVHPASVVVIPCVSRLFPQVGPTTLAVRLLPQVAPPPHSLMVLCIPAASNLFSYFATIAVAVYRAMCLLFILTYPSLPD